MKCQQIKDGLQYFYLINFELMQLFCFSIQDMSLFQFPNTEQTSTNIDYDLKMMNKGVLIFTALQLLDTF